jgi:hypothetical protein
VLVSFGIDQSDAKEIKTDFQFLRRFRKGTDEMQSYTMRAVITAVIGGVLGAVWLGFKTMMGK